ncbi:beta strand repeat-containing protein [Halomonas sp.]|uniref:beta strand repeat-containing protein n=1 Tax=Halomonas sp. TaxID=1486246 RepID=UPI003F8FB0DC
MAITSQQQSNIIALTVGMFDAAPGAQNLSDFANIFENNGQSYHGLADALASTSQYQSQFDGVETLDGRIDKVLANLGIQAGTDAYTSAKAHFDARVAQGASETQLIVESLEYLLGDDIAEEFTDVQAQLNNKVDVATYFSVDRQQNGDSLAELQGVIGNVTADPATVEAAKQAIDEDGNPSDGNGNDYFLLTQRADNFTGENAGGNGVDTLFEAPVTQNETGSGALANTFETGDRLDGGENSTNTLRADLIATGTIQDNGQGVAISAETTNIQNVFLRAQANNLDNDEGANNSTKQATIDAEKMAGVEQWWSDNSRANIRIEDIRTATQDTTFGMRETDPYVSLNAYFNPLYLEGDVSSDSELSLVIQQIDGDQVLTAEELQNITVREINFTVGGEAVTLQSEAISAANTWDELETAIAAELEAQNLEGLTVSNNGNGQFVIDDAQGRPFEIVDGEALIFGAAADIDVRNRVEVGRLEEEGPTETDVILDGAGGGSMGGFLNIGANSGGRGVEVFNVEVDRDSHLQGMSSINGAEFNGLVPNEYLQVVNLVNIGANGDLQVGARTDTLDGRAANTGLINVREVNADGFQGDLNVGIELNNDSITRYLDSATDTVEFNYTAGTGDDLFNIRANQALSGDQDFAMNVDMGAGNDRLVINVPVVRAVTVDGGEGENSIVVSQSHGTNANNTFAEFANFQTYEVEGTGFTDTATTRQWNVDNTTHNFTSMAGVEDVVVATDGNNPAAVTPATGDALSTVRPTEGDDTTLINMAADQSVTVSGKNQTLGNNSTADQLFGTIQLTNDQGTDRTVTLENTARLANSTNGVRTDGVLSVNNLTVDSNAQLDGTASEVRNLTIDSSGDRSVANAIANLNAAAVNTLNLVGSQELTINVENMATLPGTAQSALSIDGSALTGNLNLALNGALLNQITGNGTDTISGTAGEEDTLMLHGAMGANNALNATGFEAVQFGSVAGTMFGDLQVDTAASGTFNASSVAISEFNLASVGAFELINLGNGAVVNLGDANLDADGEVVNGQTQTGLIELDAADDAGAGTDPAASIDVNLLSVLATGQTHSFDIDDYRAINIDVAHAADAAAATGDARDLTLGLDVDARTLNITGGDQGGVNSNGVYDSLDLTATELPNSLTRIDVSEYAGEVTLTMQQGAIVDADETDVTFVMSENSAKVTLSNEDAIDTAHNSIFQFTGEKGNDADVSTWTIDNAKVFGNGTLDVNTNNATVLDISDLGITGYAGLDIIQDGTDTRIVSEAQNDDGQVSWEIVLTGITATDVVEQNFNFA